MIIYEEYNNSIGIWHEMKMFKTHKKPLMICHIQFNSRDFSVLFTFLCQQGFFCHWTEMDQNDEESGPSGAYLFSFSKKLKN